VVDLVEIILECKDALEGLRELEDESIDLIVTDPPYNSPALTWDRKTDEWQFKWLEEAYRVLKEGGSIYVFFAPLNMYGVEGWIREHFTLKNLIVWHHPNLYGAGMSYGRDRFKSTWDMIFYAVKGNQAKHSKNIAQESYLRALRGFDVMIYPQERPLLHKAQKPLKLVRRLVYLSSEEGDWILDPFFGSGTTAVACKELRRNFIGFDNDPKCLEIAKQRIFSATEIEPSPETLAEPWLLKRKKKKR